MSIITDVLTAGSNNHQTTSEAGNFFATDMITDGVVGAITNTSGVAPSTGAWAVNQNTGTDMNITIGTGVGYVTATPTGQNSQRLRARNTSVITQAIANNTTGSTRYDWIYRAVDATAANNPNAAADNVTSIVVSRSTSNTVDNGTPPTYGVNMAIVTVTNGAAAIVNGNIADMRTQSGTAALGAVGWTSFTPTLVNLAIGTGGNAFNTGFYQQINKTINIHGRITLGTSGQSVGANPYMILPVSINTTTYSLATTYTPIIGMIRYTAGGAGFFGPILYQPSLTANAAQFVYFQASNTQLSGMGPTSPATWGAGDWISYQMTYETA